MQEFEEALTREGYADGVEGYKSDIDKLKYNDAQPNFSKRCKKLLSCMKN